MLLAAIATCSLPLHACWLSCWVPASPTTPCLAPVPPRPAPCSYLHPKLAALDALHRKLVLAHYSDLAPGIGFAAVEATYTSKERLQVDELASEFEQRRERERQLRLEQGGSEYSLEEEKEEAGSPAGASSPNSPSPLALPHGRRQPPASPGGVEMLAMEAGAAPRTPFGPRQLPWQ